jgi:hypothetical protein
MVNKMLSFKGRHRNPAEDQKITLHHENCEGSAISERGDCTGFLKALLKSERANNRKPETGNLKQETGNRRKA